jgi:hypothetical protein
MTKKDYVVVARILSTVKNGTERDRLTREFSSWFQADNPQFDLARFIAAVSPRSADHRRRTSRRSRR